ncbi:MAG: family 16 glycoside hydrolase, partial [Verrucomicrobiota bacterium]
NDSLATYTSAEKKTHAELIAKKPERKSAIENLGAVFAGRTPTMWTLEELSSAAETGLKGRDFEKGRQMFTAAACLACHRFGNAGGMTGPDLTGSGGRYSAHDLLDQIIHPSKEINEQFAPIMVTMENGDVVSGVVVNLNGDGVTVNTDLSDPNQRVNIDRKKVKSIEVSKVSPMPPMLLNMLKKEEVLDLVAYCLSGGDESNKMFASNGKTTSAVTTKNETTRVADSGTSQKKKTVAKKEKEPRMVNLFAGGDFSQWSRTNGEPVGKGWKIENGIVHRFDKGGDIITKALYKDFDLRFEWKISKKGNSGVKYRAKKSLGLEYQVLDDKEHPDGKDPTHRSGSLYDLLAAPDSKPINPVGDWNESRIVANGSQLTHWLNGEKLLTIEYGSDDWKARFKKSKYRKHEGFGDWFGSILLQDHADPVWYRNVRIRTLAGGD